VGVVFDEATAVVNRGRTAVTVQPRLYDGDGRLLAQTTQIQAVRPPAT
jgi:acyl-coenzyme A thioesterase PaaI-like protein